MVGKKVVGEKVVGGEVGIALLSLLKSPIDSFSMFRSSSFSFFSSSVVGKKVVGK